MSRPLRVTADAAVVLAAASAVLAVLLAARTPDALPVLFAVTAVVCLPVAPVGAAVVRSRPRNAVSWILLAAGVCLPLNMALQIAVAAAYDHGDGAIPAPALLATVNTFAALAGVPLAATFGLLLFPDGRLGGPSRRRRVLAAACGTELAAIACWALFSPTMIDYPDQDNPTGLPGAAGQAAEGGVLAILLLGPVALATSTALMRRARRAPDPAGRALRLVAGAGYAIAASQLVCVAVGMSGGDTVVVSALENTAALVLGAAAWVGIVRYGLFDLRRVMHRALIYGLLTAGVVAVYLVLATALGALAGGRLPGALATAGAALTVLPLRDLLQRRASQLVYGLRDEPAAVVGRLGDRLHAAAEPADVLPAAARTIAEVLRLPYVAIEVEGVAVGAHGVTGSGHRESLPLPLPLAEPGGDAPVGAAGKAAAGRSGEAVGMLVLETRDPAERFGTAERELLGQLARQVAVTVRALSLAAELRTSRERLVGAREEERRRLRHDLHDGLGASLTGIALGIDTACRSLPAGTATGLLARLRAETENVIAEIRRIVYDLRPAVLDELGLTEAVRSHAAQLGGVSVLVPAALPALPAAVEVAAYRIAVEALTNASRHAPGARVEVEVAFRPPGLEVVVRDDGGGLPDGFRAGVGITSMRRRATELGGTCTVTRRDPTGTIVHAVLPLAEPA
ncbi:sensor histidine kinase [Actinomadura montaniterrae]|uniref:Histidine kinase/HSP90-like ATPase domain-containing protein n=1 Tax=Actinomadura montaniterrae TaxID=1803903 RepID=A0A6L3VSI4_9ACTN|nr:ATP-binding protein [Actinomadura montaniterrae]KAB2379006.1 hypothetical protein F9B16_22395 [Actinomadura montaniterrae]